MPGWDLAAQPGLEELADQHIRWWQIKAATLTRCSGTQPLAQPWHLEANLKASACPGWRSSAV